MIVVLEPGLLTTVQDVSGRRGWQHLGVPTCGAADPFSARLANRLVGNADDAPLLEMTLVGPTLRFERAQTIALAGADLGAQLGGIRLAPASSCTVRPGSTLHFGAALRGARAYLAVAGGLAVPRVLGSAATDLRSGFGGYDGRALATGDVLETIEGAPDAPRLGLEADVADARPTVRITAGPHLGTFGPGAFDALCATTWRVRPESDRAGVRLSGPPLREPMDAFRAEVASVGLPPGAIQVPPDGQPIVMLADRPVTGGYAMLACVARADIGQVAQLVAGDEVRFEAVSLAAAVAALRDRERRLAAIRPVEPDAADGASWAGALD